MKSWILSLFISFITIGVFGQTYNLANEYYRSGEYEKAGTVYKKLFETQPTNFAYFNSYIECLLALEEYKTAEIEIEQQIKAFPSQMQLYVTLGNLKERQFLPEEANRAYRSAIENIPPNVGVIRDLANAFQRITKYDMAIDVYVQGSQILDNEGLFAHYLAGLYGQSGNKPKMIEYYLKAINHNPQNLEYYKTNLKRSINVDEDLEEIQRQTYALIQSEPDNAIFPELLQWVFLEKKDYPKALRQARALDRKYNQGGVRVKLVADIAYNDGDYETAINGYEYVTVNESINSFVFIEAKNRLLKSKRKVITNKFDYHISELDTVQAEYVKFIEDYGINQKTEIIVQEYAEFLALYKNDLVGAINILKEITSMMSISKSVRAMSKISMADYYLMQGEIWEATLLYSQVEKKYNEEYLGEIARFKNAKLAYYAGNFGWAQEQFDILKSATSKLISNDAIDLSVFIMDNMGLDTTDVPLKMFSEAELLTVQNKFDEAFVKLDSITILYPEHGLLDDIIYQKAEMHYLLKHIDKARELYTMVFEKYPEDIRADNALFKVAEIYENNLKDLEQAKLLYEKLFIDFSNSTFAIEARKRYRILRGDTIQ